jgi:hypothetical protein
MAQAKIGISLGVEGAQASAAAVEDFSKRGATALERLRGGFTQMGERADWAESRVKKLNRGVNDAAGSVQLLSTIIPGVGGQFGALASTIGNVADVLGTLSSILLRNPLGLAAVAITGVAAAYAAFNRSADEATQAVNASGSGASSAAIEWAKLVDPLKTVGTLIDQIRAKQIDAVGGPRVAVDLTLSQKRAELVAAQSALREQQEKPFVPGVTNREAAQNRDVNQARADAIRKLVPEIAALTAEIQKLEKEEEKLRILQKAGENEFAGLGRAQTQKLIDEGLAAQEKLRAAGAAAAAEEQRAIDALIAKYAPTVKAERELAAAREDTRRLMEAGKLTVEEYERVLSGLSDAEYKNTEAAQQRAQLQQFAARTIEEIKTAEERYAEAIRDTDAAQRANLLTTEQAQRRRDLAKQQLDQATDESRASKQTARELGLAFSSAFENAVVGGKRLRDVIDGLGQDLLRVFIRRQLTEPLLELFDVTAKNAGLTGSNGLLGGIFGGIGRALGNSIGSLFNPGTVLPGDPTGGLGPAFLADGGVFSGGAQIIPFAAGGSVVNRPSIFPMAGGRLGLMGEAGPEAIMPLSRGADGKLGVRGGGGGPVIQISNSIDARGADKSLRDALPGLLRQNSEQTIARIEQLLDRGGTFSRKSGRRIA